MKHAGSFMGRGRGSCPFVLYIPRLNFMSQKKERKSVMSCMKRSFYFTVKEPIQEMTEMPLK